MTPKQIAREKLLAAALELVASELHRGVRFPGAYDDAEAEYNEDRFNDAAREYMLEDQRERDKA